MLAALLSPASSIAEESKPSPKDPQTAYSSFEGGIEPIITEPVILDGVVLFRVRGISTFPAEARAAAIEGRIAEIARDRQIPTTEIKVVEREQGSAIAAAGKPVMVVIDADALIENIGRQVLADLNAQSIRGAVTRYRNDREPRALGRSAASALAAIAGMAVLLYMLLRLYRFLDAKIKVLYRARVADLSVKGFKVLQAEQMWRALRGAMGTAHALAGLACVFLALQFSLGQFPLTRGAAAGLLDVIVLPLRTMGLGMLSILPDLVFLTILIIVTRFVLKTVKLFFGAIQQGSVVLSGFDADWGLPTYRIVRLIIVAFALVVAYPYIPGSNSDAFKGISLFAGVIFSLGSSSFISNIIAGYAMTYRRAFQVGDWIGVGGEFGEATAIRLLVTNLRTPKNEEIVVPNSTILSANVTNYSKLAKSRGLILHTTVGIGYETPWRQVEAMLIMAAERSAGVLRDPAPFVLQTALGDFSVTYELNVYSDNPAQMKIAYTELHRNILDVFNEYGVQIMTPSYESDTEQPKVVPRDQWYVAPAKP